MFLLVREISLVSNKNYGRGSQNKLSKQTRVLTFLLLVGRVATKFFSDFSVTKNANSNLIAVLGCRNMLLLNVKSSIFPPVNFQFNKVARFAAHSGAYCLLGRSPISAFLWNLIGADR